MYNGIVLLRLAMWSATKSYNFILLYKCIRNKWICFAFILYARIFFLIKALSQKKKKDLGRFCSRKDWQTDQNSKIWFVRQSKVSNLRLRNRRLRKKNNDDKDPSSHSGNGSGKEGKQEGNIFWRPQKWSFAVSPFCLKSQCVLWDLKVLTD